MKRQNASNTSQVTFPLLMACLMCLWQPAYAVNSDVAKEHRWADQIIDSLMDGDELWLNDGSGHEFLGLMTEAEEESTNAIILLHGIGVHPNWPEVIYPLRVGLPESNWATLSIQMPILKNEAEGAEYVPLFPEVPARIDSAVSYLLQEGYDRVVIVAHSMGSTMAAYYLTRTDSDAISAFVAIGMGDGIEGTEIDSVKELSKLTLPLLDVYGSDDLDSVLSSSEQRKGAAVTAGNTQYTQTSVEGADHFFQAHSESLLQHVVNWLELLGTNN